DDVVHEAERGVLAATAAVAHSGEVDGDDAEVAEEKRRDEAPPAGMRAETVRKQQRRLVRLRRVPRQVVDRRAVNLRETGFARRGDRPGEPLGSGSLFGHVNRTRSAGQVAGDARTCGGSARRWSARSTAPAAGPARRTPRRSSRSWCAPRRR